MAHTLGHSHLRALTLTHTRRSAAFLIFRFSAFSAFLLCVAALWESALAPSFNFRPFFRDRSSETVQNSQTSKPAGSKYFVSPNAEVCSVRIGGHSPINSRLRAPLARGSGLDRRAGRAPFPRRARMEVHCGKSVVKLIPNSFKPHNHNAFQECSFLRS